MVEKRQTGFKFGKHKTKVLAEVGEVKSIAGKVYKMVVLQTEDGNVYDCLRLYNKDGKFIKQFLMDLEVTTHVAHLMIASHTRTKGGEAHRKSAGAGHTDA